MHFRRREDMHEHLEFACNQYTFAENCPIADMLMKVVQ